MLGKFKKGLAKTRKGILTRFKEALTSGIKINEDTLEDLEEILITADLGVATVQQIIDYIREKAEDKNIKSREELFKVVENKIKDYFSSVESRVLNVVPPPAVIMVVGVNGTGKTTTIGKLAYKLKNQGKKVLLVAADTFRAAAIEQLEIWSKRANVPLIKHKENSDPSAVVFDAVTAAISRKVDCVIIDTAGRLHTKANLMEEIKKIKRVIENKLPHPINEILLVVDASTGQNAINQAKVFKEAINITGLVLTKLDGTAKGGIVVAIKRELNIPVKFVGLGEQIDDLQEFSPEEYVQAIFED